VNVGTCGFCGRTIPAVEILDHLREEHAIDEELLCWPDGTPVVIERDLAPGDFNDAR